MGGECVKMENKRYLLGEGWRWVARLDKVEKCSRMEVRKGEDRRGRGGFGETTGQSSLKPAKPISFVLGRFYHGAVYHRLPKQCRCCSHCEPRPDLHPLHPLIEHSSSRRRGESIDIYDILPLRSRSIFLRLSPISSTMIDLLVRVSYRKNCIW